MGYGNTEGVLTRGGIDELGLDIRYRTIVAAVWTLDAPRVRSNTTSSSRRGAPWDVAPEAGSRSSK